MSHPLTSIELDLYKDIGGRGHLQLFPLGRAFRPSDEVQIHPLSFSRNFPFNTVVPISKHRPCAGQEASSHVRP